MTEPENVLTVVATSPHPPLAVQQIHALQAHLGFTGAPDWLEPGRAVDLFFTGGQLLAVRDQAENFFNGTAVDVIVQPRQGRRKKLLLADMDSTMIEQECLDELADAVGLKAETAAITERAMRGELDFADALRERVANLRALDVAALARTKERLTFMQGGHTLIATARQNDTTCLLVSGGFSYFTAYVAQRLGFHAHHANVLEEENGKLTGAVREPILDKHAKLRILNETAQSMGLTLAQTMAVGDGANDLPMLLAAGLGFAHHAKPAVNAQAPARIRHSDLTALLFAQGYRAAEFAYEHNE
jgi:phosphoserine phosphatase